MPLYSRLYVIEVEANARSILSAMFVVRSKRDSISIELTEGTSLSDIICYTGIR